MWFLRLRRNSKEILFILFLQALYLNQSWLKILFLFLDFGRDKLWIVFFLFLLYIKFYEYWMYRIQNNKWNIKFRHKSGPFFFQRKYVIFIWYSFIFGLVGAILNRIIWFVCLKMFKKSTETFSFELCNTPFVYSVSAIYCFCKFIIFSHLLSIHFHSYLEPSTSKRQQCRV